MQNKKGLPILFLIFFLLGGLTFIFTQNIFKKESFSVSDIAPIRQNPKSNQLISPLFICGSADKNLFDDLKPLHNKLSTFIEKQIENGSVTKASVYFRELNSGHWTGVNEDENYVLASLVKLPLFIAYLKYAETEPDILNKQILFNSDQDEDLAQEVQKPEIPIIKGKKYTVSELLWRMITYSGNNSHIMLANNLGLEFQRQVYDDLQVPFIYDIKDNGITDAISVKEFSNFFRTLYNATYLNQEMSQKALEILSKTTFKDGIKFGIPEDVTVAHKFGERTVHNINTGETYFRELHDCGIIYYPNDPYLLCVMTKGDDFSKLEKTIQNISQIVYSTLHL